MSDRGGSARRRWAWAVSAAAHAGLLALILSVAPSPAPREFDEPEVLPVVLAPPEPPKPPQPPAPEPKPAPTPPKAAAPKPVASLKVRRPKPAPADVAPLPVAPGRAASPGDELGEAEVAGAATAETGGGECNMAAWLEAKLRGDRRVREAMAAAYRGKPLLLWRDGTWIQRSGEEGQGLAAVREAVMWEVAFAPVACRRQPVHGLVLLKLAAGPGSPRVVIGGGAWRWQDLLFAKGRG
ncbi:MAG TPA: hypothetical protein VLI41_14425 [Phenylobacterium sp.]|uniref:hypothetical protein n=1 Tax=Phenylobacterium sp. TaxID=1871053 RepID=UPI002CE37D11|nr:hypothetical protein [Phenylobacterium sp.]HSV04387.1 hypothetical protein [Phenylobacterium sp.]